MGEKGLVVCKQQLGDGLLKNKSIVRQQQPSAYSNFTDIISCSKISISGVCLSIRSVHKVASTISQPTYILQTQYVLEKVWTLLHRRCCMRSVAETSRLYRLTRRCGHRSPLEAMLNLTNKHSSFAALIRINSTAHLQLRTSISKADYT